MQMILSKAVRVILIKELLTIRVVDVLTSSQNLNR